MHVCRSLPALLAAVVATQTAATTLGAPHWGEVAFEGLLQADYNAFDSDVTDLDGDPHDGGDSDRDLRRAEFILKGKGLGGHLEWVVGYDARAEAFLDANLTYRPGGSGRRFLQLGQFKQPNGLEELSSTKSNDFISKAVVTNTFALGRRLGVAYRHGDADRSVTAGMFIRPITDGAPVVDAAGAPGSPDFRPPAGRDRHGVGGALRGTWAPLNDAGRVLHFGGSIAYQDIDADVTRIRSRPQADLSGARLVDTGVLHNTGDQVTLGAEALWIARNFKLQGEYMTARVHRSNMGKSPAAEPSSGDFTGASWTVSGLWNLSRETWTYRDGVPVTSAPDDPTVGMWQLGLRYDSIDLDDGRIVPGAAPGVEGVLGGEMDTWTVGVNWYWRSNVKVMLNYVQVTSSRYDPTTHAVVDDDPDIVEARAQFHW